MALPVPPASLRPLVLPGLQTQPKYQPGFYWGNPIVHYDPLFNSRLDMMTSVSSRVVRTHSIGHGNKKVYGIRRYPAQVVGESLHPIETLMKKCHARNLAQRQMLHVLMPTQAFLHVKDRGFYTVSEHAFMTVADVLLGVKQWPSMLCHDEIWSIVKQVLTGTRFLISQGLQHTMLNLQNILVTTDGVVKIGAIHHIGNETPDGWIMMSESLVQVAVSLIEVSKEPCSRCTDTICEGGRDRGCCDGPSMLYHVDSLRETLDITRCLTDGSLGSENGIKCEAIMKALHLEFINQAKGQRLGTIAEFASAKVYRDAMPVLRSTESVEPMTSFLPRHKEKSRANATGRKGSTMVGSEDYMEEDTSGFFTNTENTFRTDGE